MSRVASLGMIRATAKTAAKAKQRHRSPLRSSSSAFQSGSLPSALPIEPWKRQRKPCPVTPNRITQPVEHQQDDPQKRHQNVEGLAGLLDGEKRPAVVRQIVQLGLELDPEYPPLLVDRLIHSPGLDSAEFDDTVTLLLDRSETQTSRLARALFESEDLEQSAAVLERLTRAQPSSATAWA